MIHGLKLDVGADELIQKIDDRLTHHQGRVAAYQLQLQKLDAIEPRDEDDDDPISSLRGRESPKESVERKAREHQERTEVLTFLRDHVVRGEVYRLDEDDLRAAEILPNRCGRW